MGSLLRAIALCLCLCAIGCRYRLADPGLSSSVTFVVHGIDGAGPWYGGLVEGLREGRPRDQVELVSWGVPLLLLPNLVLSNLHDSGESHLAERIREWREARPDGRVSLVGHSAGCGVILGALERLDRATMVNEVILLGPAVSSDYRLAPALRRVRGTMHVFYSSGDEILPSTFLTGTYDGAVGESAGRVGFDAASLPAELKLHLRQHEHRLAWERLGCSGGHFGWRSRAFAQAVLAPLLDWPAPHSQQQ
jgi:pimeloyl-ACP methyl ester carboxylesterase